MEIGNQPKLLFQGVDFVSINFDSNKQYDNKSTINLDIEPKVFYPKDDLTSFKIIMNVSVRCEEYFDLNLIALGIFEFDKEFNDLKLKKSLINANAPAIMFPYIRAFITSLTSNLGEITGPLILPTQFFQGELEEISLDED